MFWLTRILHWFCLLQIIKKLIWGILTKNSWEVCVFLASPPVYSKDQKSYCIPQAKWGYFFGMWGRFASSSQLPKAAGGGSRPGIQPCWWAEGECIIDVLAEIEVQMCVCVLTLLIRVRGRVHRSVVRGRRGLRQHWLWGAGDACSFQPWPQCHCCVCCCLRHE